MFHAVDSEDEIELHTRLKKKKKKKKRIHSEIELNGIEVSKKRKKVVNERSEGYEQQMKGYVDSGIDSHLQESDKEEKFKNESFQSNHAKKKKKDKKNQKKRKREYSQSEESLINENMEVENVGAKDTVSSHNVKKKKKKSKKKNNEMIQDGTEQNQHRDTMGKQKVNKENKEYQLKKTGKINRSSLEMSDEEAVKQKCDNLFEEQTLVNTESRKKKKRSKSKEDTNKNSFAVTKTGEGTSRSNDDKSDVKDHRSSMNTGLMLHSKWEINEELRERLKHEHVVVKKGKWSEREEKLLKANVDAILKEFDIAELRMLLFPQEIEDKNKRKEIKKMLRDIDFYRKLGEGINRTLFNVYRKALRMFDENNYLGSFSEEEKSELKRLHDLYGNKWTKISKIMGRSALAVNHAFLKLQDHELGVWSEEEEKRLKEAVSTLTDPNKGRSLLHWTVVAQMVGTRNADQCRNKWLYSLCWKTSEQVPAEWSQWDDLKFITRLYQSKVMQECDIDWEEIAKDWDKTVSASWLRRRWMNIKKAKIHPVRHKDFEEIVDYMYSAYREQLYPELQD